MSQKDPRKDGRMQLTEPVHLSAIDQPLNKEATFTQNISSRGARVATQKVWPTGSLMQIKSLESNFSAQARVVYWRSFSSSKFAIGLEFVSQEGEWPGRNALRNKPASMKSKKKRS